MSDGSASSREPTSTREAIMHATYDALHKHGYAGLSISRIAEEGDFSKSTFYHHFDDKDDILLSFADFIIVQFERGFELESTGGPVEDLYVFLNFALGTHPLAADRPDSVERMGVWIELRSQSIHDPAFAEKFTETADKYIDHLTGILAEGIEQGVFNDVDARKMATFLLTIVDGAILEVTTRTDDLRPLVWEKMDEYIRDNLIRGDVDIDESVLTDDFELADDAE
ncbi:TetR/AcrR family transcriptional regulator [Halonotius terrestris]|uniref:TetR/AcrR family transcriptional regulator n=1 Tax=Halonotius terrestris TaxID=2487750 RepID=A0A8J8TD62_9EURY|nr:TetR/AcrR family transcriptional regulator [Halonotius terrestris]TQQ82741.1 TetR/AcrR family transcriptional regulator [Halonotius terrestris]